MSEKPHAEPIILITHEFYPKRGGIATFAEEIACAAARLGHDVEVWAQAAPLDQEKPWPFKIRRLTLKGTHDLGCQVRLGIELIRERRRLRHATVYMPEPGPLLAMMYLQFISAFRPRRLVLTVHGSEILRFHRHPIIRPLARRLIDHASKVSVLTRFTRDLLCLRFPNARRKTILTPGALRVGLSNTDHVPAPPSILPPKNGRAVILTVGRLHPRKGQHHTLRALEMLPPELHQKVEYWLVGTRGRGAFEKQLRATAAHAPFPVHFLGNIPNHELGAVYRRADIFAMTSINHGMSVEGFGLVYLEASAHGLPVVAHQVGGVPEAVIDGATGLLAPPDEPDRLVAAFERLIREPALRRRLGDAGRDWARRNTWDESARLLFSLPHAAPAPRAESAIAAVDPAFGHA
ncbi:glycosyltransferase family 4 protein [Termitidicoccus mucosus]|uniref:glycosyltransferase family 4 protein n=1 Tax=Termitidicoccus mucosus TaxID=1184151 RepID=UPI000837AC8A